MYISKPSASSANTDENNRNANIPDTNKFKKNSLYSTIKKITFNTLSTTIGIIYNHLPTIETSGTDYLTTIDIIDEIGDTLRVRIFSYSNIYENCFAEKDIVIIKNIILKRDARNRSNVVGYVKDDGSVMVVKCGEDEKLIVKKGNESVIITEDLAAVIKDLHLKLNDRFNNRSSYRLKKPLEDISISKLKKIEAIQENTFFDFKGLCISIGDKTGTTKNSAYAFVDGTENTNILPEKDIDGYRKNEILKIIFWNSKDAINVQKGQCYLMRNLRIQNIGDQLIANFSESNTYAVVEIPRSDINLPNKKLTFKDIKTIVNDNNEVSDLLKSFRRRTLNDLQIGYNLISVFYDQQVTETPYIICETCNVIKNDECTSSCKVATHIIKNILISDETHKLFVLCSKNEISDLLNKRVKGNKFIHEMVIKKGDNEMLYMITDLILF